MSAADEQTIAEMQATGGGFVQALADAWLAAERPGAFLQQLAELQWRTDESNRGHLDTAFPLPLWYGMAESRAALENAFPGLFDEYAARAAARMEASADAAMEEGAPQ